jgi:hypothetical protein
MYIHVQAPSPERYAEQSTEEGTSAEGCPLNRSLRATKGAEPRSHLVYKEARTIVSNLGRGTVVKVEIGVSTA